VTETTNAVPPAGLQIESAAQPHLRRWVVAAAGVVAAGYFASITVRVLVGDQAWIVTEYIAVAGALAGLVLALGNHLRAGGTVVVAAVWAELHSSMILSSGQLSVAGFPVFPVLILGTGLLLGGSAAIVLALVTAATAPLCVVIAQQLGSSVMWPSMGLHGWVVLGTSMLAAAVIVDQGIKSFRETLWSRIAHEHKFASLAEHSPYGIVLLDEGGRVETLNPAAEALLGFTEAEAQGRRFPDVLGPAHGELDIVLPPDGADTSLREVEIRRGSERQTVEVSGSRTITPEGTAGTQILLRDISARREMERHTIQLGRMLDQALSEAYVFDAETLHLRYANMGARRNLGYEGQDLRALTITDVAPALTRGVVRDVMTDLTARPDEVIALTTQHRRKDGSAYPVEARLHLVSFAGGSAVGLFALAVSERAGMESGRPQAGRVPDIPASP